MSKLDRAFILTLFGGCISIANQTYPIYATTRQYQDTVLIGLVIIVLSIFLREAPGRNVTLGAVITAISATQLVAEVFAMALGGAGVLLVLYPSGFQGYFIVYPYVLIGGSILSILGGVTALRLKTSPS